MKPHTHFYAAFYAIAAFSIRTSDYFFQLFQSILLLVTYRELQVLPAAFKHAIDAQLSWKIKGYLLPGKRYASACRNKEGLQHKIQIAAINQKEKQHLAQHPELMKRLFILIPFSNLWMVKNINIKLRCTCLMNRINNNNIVFLKSAFASDDVLVPTQKILSWINEHNREVFVNIKKIPFASLIQWSIDEKGKSLRHQSGKFFSIDGIRVKTNYGYATQWDQPIISQPEIGYLGFITKEFNGILHFLVQAKIEPGNVNIVQLSPTLQATKSNYTRVHAGKAPPYLEYFRDAKPCQILADQLQSEQGARFLRKRNRNIILKIEEDVPVLDNYSWVTLAQLKELMKYDNLVNMDTRTVIAGIPYGDFIENTAGLLNILDVRQPVYSIESRFLQSALSHKNTLHSFDDILSFITRLKSFYELDVEIIPLTDVEQWNLGECEIFHSQHKYFKVIATEVEIANREVLQWTQPMVESAQEGICAFVCKEINGLLHFAVQAKLECGNFDIIELAPTVQCLTGNYRNTESKKNLPFLEYVLSAPKETIVFDTLQSEEGGRFFQEQNRNLLIMAGEELSVELPDNYIWMTLHQLHTFMKFNNYLNIQARSLLAAISFKTKKSAIA